jgi:hypothetical protein
MKNVKFPFFSLLVAGYYLTLLIAEKIALFAHCAKRKKIIIFSSA